MILNIIVLILEVLYYSLFMKFTRGKEKYYKYLIAFSIVTIIGLLINMRGLISYFLLILLIILALRYIVDKETKMYDMLIIVIMLFISLIVEFPIYIIFYKLLRYNHFLTTMIFQILKILLVFILRKKFNKMYIRLQTLWNNNNFYIRYITSVVVYIYVIITCVLLIYRVWR